MPSTFSVFNGLNNNCYECIKCNLVGTSSNVNIIVAILMNGNVNNGIFSDWAVCSAMALRLWHAITHCALGDVWLTPRINDISSLLWNPGKLGVKPLIHLGCRGPGWWIEDWFCSQTVIQKPIGIGGKNCLCFYWYFIYFSFIYNHTVSIIMFGTLYFPWFVSVLHNIIFVMKQFTHG